MPIQKSTKTYYAQMKQISKKYLTLVNLLPARITKEYNSVQVY